MAPTKSQDYNGKTRALEEEQGLVSTRSSKRRTEDKLDGAAGRLAPKKRRILTEKQDIASVPETALAEDFNSLEGPNGNNDAHERIPLESNPTSAATPPPNFSQYTSEIAGKFRKEESTISKNADSTEKALEEETDSAHPEASTEQATQRQKNLKRVAKGTTKETVVNDDRLSKSVPDDVDVKSTLIMAPKRNHKRFASEELETSELHEQDVGNGQEALHGQLSEVSSSSEDEEPETVTATDGFGQARAAAIDAAKVSARQEASKKLRRREHDLKLKMQAKMTRKKAPVRNPTLSPTASAPAIPSEATIDTETPDSVINDNGQRSLPALLPEEILAAEPDVRPPTPRLSANKAPTKNKRKFLDREVKPPKDRIVGSVRVRVLQSNTSILPPKVSQVGKALRESWLTGRRGPQSKDAVPRRQLRTSFLRK